MQNISIDIETYSGYDLGKCGVYKYAEAPDFDILLFGYSIDGGDVQVVDLTAGEAIPEDVLAALSDPAITNGPLMHPLNGSASPPGFAKSIRSILKTMRPPKIRPAIISLPPHGNAA